MRGKVPFHGLPISSMNVPAIGMVCLILALEAVDHYTIKAINHTLEETHDTKHQTAHHRG